MIFIGIDPGLDGAAVALGDVSAPQLLDTPTLELTGGTKKRRDYNLVEMAAWLWRIRNLAADCNGAFALLEQVHAMPEQGVSSSFNFGMGYGIWRGLLVGIGIPYERVTPQRWKGAMLDGQLKGKDAARLKALELFPEQAYHFKRKKDDGRADAYLIAEHARRTRA